MDFFADDFEAKELVLLEDNEAGSQGIPLRFDYYDLLLRLIDYVIKPRTLQLINPGSIFSFEDTSDIEKTYVLLFDMTQFAEVVSLYEQLNSELRAKNSDYKIVVRLLITQLLYLLKEIQYLLCFSDMSIKQISHALNFETLSQPRRFFKRYEGMSPKSYRLKNR